MNWSRSTWSTQRSTPPSSLPALPPADPTVGTKDLARDASRGQRSRRGSVERGRDPRGRGALLGEDLDGRLRRAGLAGELGDLLELLVASDLQVLERVDERRE